MNLYDYQLDALERMHNGCVLYGPVGCGKSLTALAYYFLENFGNPDFLIGKSSDASRERNQPLYIITTARKRDTWEWDTELANFLMERGKGVVIDSWNNIKKYTDVEQSFFIFDEQRVVGHGAWVKSFLKITRKNSWILLSATPGDTWSDYIPVFVANGYFKNRTQFMREHAVFDRFSKYPRIDRYMNTVRLDRLSKRILVPIKYKREINVHKEIFDSNYDKDKYRRIVKYRQDLVTGEPFDSPTSYCMALRNIVNSADSRQIKLLELAEQHDRLIVFYNYNFELDILRSLCFGSDVEVAEWNGWKHQPLPQSKRWIYLVQYTAGCEGWNCVQTNAMVFYSLNYSYKTMAQAAGRIDRTNTTYKDLYYYYFSSRSSIDKSIERALRNKKKFQEYRLFNAKG